MGHLALATTSAMFLPPHLQSEHTFSSLKLVALEIKPAECSAGRASSFVKRRTYIPILQARHCCSNASKPLHEFSRSP